MQAGRGTPQEGLALPPSYRWLSPLAASHPQGRCSAGQAKQSRMWKGRWPAHGACPAACLRSRQAVKRRSKAVLYRRRLLTGPAPSLRCWCSPLVAWGSYAGCSGSAHGAGRGRQAGTGGGLGERAVGGLASTAGPGRRRLQMAGCAAGSNSTRSPVHNESACGPCPARKLAHRPVALVPATASGRGAARGGRLANRLEGAGWASPHHACSCLPVQGLDAPVGCVAELQTPPRLAAHAQPAHIEPGSRVSQTTRQQAQ